MRSCPRSLEGLLRLPVLMTVQRLRHQQRKAVAYLHTIHQVHRHSVTLPMQQQLLQFLSKMKNSEFDDEVSISSLCNKFPFRKPLFEHIVMCRHHLLRSNAYLNSGLIMRQNRARMSDCMQESLVYLRCNSHL